MRHLSKLSIIAFLLSILIIPLALKAQWIPTQGIDGARMSTLDINDTVLFISAAGQGVTKKNVTGGAWQTVFQFQQSRDLFHAGVFEFCNPAERVYRSSDLGKTWIQPLQNFYGAWQLKHTDTVLFVCSGDYVMRSTDYGASWSDISSMFTTGSWKRIMANDGYIYCYETKYGFNRLYFSANQGLSWDSIPITGLLIPGDIPLKTAFFFQGNHYLSRSQGVFRFNPVTSQWISLNDSLYFNDFAGFGNELYGAGQGVYRVDQGSGNFIPLNNGLPGTEILKLSCTVTDIYCAAFGGVYKTDAAFNWENISSGLHGGSVSSLSKLGNEVWVLCDIGNFKSTDNGVTFVEQVMPAGARKIILSPMEYYLMTSEGFYISYNQGTSWVQATNGLTSYLWLQDFSYGGGMLYLSVITQPSFINEIFATPTASINWYPVCAIPSGYGYTASTENLSLVVMENQSNYPYPARITDNGFQSIDTVQAVTMGDLMYARSDYNRLYILGPWEFYRSADIYNTWTKVDFPSTIRLSDVSENSFGIVGGGWSLYQPWVFITYDLGSNWSDITDNLNPSGSFSVNVVQVSDNRLFCGTSANGLWYRDDVLTSTSNIPEKQSSLKISPNPAKSQTVLEFEEAKSSSAVRIIITDMMGRTCFDRTNASCGQPVCRETLDVHSLDPGLYNVRLICGSRCESARLIISR